MNSTFNLKNLSQNIVYLREVATADLPRDVREQAGEIEILYAVHDADGKQVALVANPAIASHLAESHHMRLVTLH